MNVWVLIILLDYEFAGKKDVDFSMPDDRFKTEQACLSFRKDYLKKYNDIKGSGCLEYKE